MNNLCALPLPATRLPKSASESWRVTGEIVHWSAVHLLPERGFPSAQHTVGLLAEALGNLALALQVDVPALGLSGGVLEGKGVDTVSLLDGVFLVGLAGI